MPDPVTIFAWIVATLAGLAVVGAIAYAITWEVCAIRRTIAADRSVYVRPSRFDPSTRYWPEHSAVKVVDGITDEEADRVRDAARRILDGDRVPEVAQGTSS
jgi:hypothetical protein